MRIEHNLRKKKIIAFQTGKAVGYLTYRYASDASGKRNMELIYLFVKPSYRHRGIATKLLLNFLKMFKNIAWVSFWTGRQAEIDKSYKIYEKLGFKEIAFLEDYYEKGIGTRLYARKINNN